MTSRTRWVTGLLALFVACAAVACVVGRDESPSAADSPLSLALVTEGGEVTATVDRRDGAWGDLCVTFTRVDGEARRRSKRCLAVDAAGATIDSDALGGLASVVFEPERDCPVVVKAGRLVVCSGGAVLELRRAGPRAITLR